MSEQKIVTERKVSEHLMKLDPGLYCMFHGPHGQGPNPATGLPGVRISRPPGVAGANGGVEISGFREDGWVSTDNDAALSRVSDGPGQVLVTVYQSSLGGDALPQLQVVRLGDIKSNGAHAAHQAPAPMEAAGFAEAGIAASGPAAGIVPPAPAGAAPAVTAHGQRRGDVGGELGERGSKLWIEGFAVVPPSELRPEYTEYQGVLGRGWLSPWSQGGQFCGSRRMALPILGLRVRLRGAAAGAFECSVLGELHRRLLGRTGERRGAMRIGGPGAARGVSGDAPEAGSGGPSEPGGGAAGAGGRHAGPARAAAVLHCPCAGPGAPANGGKEGAREGRGGLACGARPGQRPRQAPSAPTVAGA